VRSLPRGDGAPMPKSVSSPKRNVWSSTFEGAAGSGPNAVSSWKPLAKNSPTGAPSGRSSSSKRRSDREPAPLPEGATVRPRP